jgi:hypothetical protein
VKRLLFAILGLLIMLSGCGGGEKTLGDKINDLARPHAFSLLRWETDMLSQEIDEHIRRPYEEDSTDSSLVVRYFSLVDQENSLRQRIENIQGGFVEDNAVGVQLSLDAVSAERRAIERETEEVLARQMSLAAATLGIHNPFDPYWTLSFTFPPVKMRLQEPPQLLVVSPRARIDRIASITLQSDTSQLDAVSLEDAVEALDVSAIVVGLGGIATYPSFVNNNYGLRTALDIAAEEWFHQYLFFRPLGFRYALDELGVAQPLDIVIMNETLAGMVAGELAAEVARTFYDGYLGVQAVYAAQPAFDFYGELCNTRNTVDTLLELGNVEETEAYMERRRLEFADHGYYIRKLNQAYFAFYGCYANQPGFENPIGVDMRSLREKSATLASFVQQASSFTSRDDLSRAVE